MALTPVSVTPGVRVFLFRIKKMSKKVIIELEFDHENVSDADVYDYLDELMDNHMLDWQFLVKPDAQRT